jgi:DNA anti-recombination protein RmuC
LSELITIIAVLLVIKIALDIRDRKKAHQDIYQRFVRLHDHLGRMTNDHEREQQILNKRFDRLSDRLECIENAVGVRRSYDTEQD